MSHKISCAELQRLINEIFLLAGCSQEGADIMADVLGKAEMRGIASHGVSRIPNYIQRIELGLVTADPNITVLRETPATALLDGDYGLGQIVATKAMELAVHKAEKNGIGIVSVRKSHHFGIAGYYTEMAARRNMIGFVCSNTTPLMPPPGGASRAIGNNPLSFGFPTGEHPPVLFDMACSAVAQGKIINADMEVRPIPEGWAVDQQGRPTTDPAEALKGFLLPAAGPKGYGLAVSIEFLAAVLSGAQVGIHLPSIRNDLENKQNCGHFFMALNIDAFEDPDEFKQRADQFITEMKNGKKAVGTEHIYMPGEIELNREVAARRDGITIPDGIFELVKETADRYHVQMP